VCYRSGIIRWREGWGIGRVRAEVDPLALSRGQVGDRRPRQNAGRRGPARVHAPFTGTHARPSFLRVRSFGPPVNHFIRTNCHHQWPEASKYEDLTDQVSSRQRCQTDVSAPSGTGKTWNCSCWNMIPRKSPAIFPCSRANQLPWIKANPAFRVLGPFHSRSQRVALLGVPSRSIQVAGPNKAGEYIATLPSGETRPITYWEDLEDIELELGLESRRDLVKLSRRSRPG
jgi:hypothetical protein